MKLGHHEWVLRTLREAGFSLTMAAHAFSVMDSYIYGFSTQEQNLPVGEEDDLVEASTLLLQLIPREKYPYLTEMITDHAAGEQVFQLIILTIGRWRKLIASPISLSTSLYLSLVSRQGSGPPTRTRD